MKYIFTIILFNFQFGLLSQIELLRFDAINLCDSVFVETYKVRPHLHSKSVYKDSIRINIRLEENCGLYLKQGAVQIEDDTINLMWTSNNEPIKMNDVIYENGTWFHPDSSSSSSHVLCECYIEVTYVFKNLKNLTNLKINNKTVLEKDSMYQIFTPTFQTFEGDTINYTDSIGIQRGKWIEFDSLNRITKIELKESNSFSSEFEKFEYHQNGEISEYYFSKRANRDFSLIEKYDTLGNLIERDFRGGIFYNDSSFDFLDIHYIEYFDSNGKLINRELIEVHNNLYEYGYYYE